MQIAGALGALRSSWNSVSDENWRFARRWIREGFTLDARAREKRQLARLGKLLEHFNTLPLDDLLPKAPSAAPASIDELKLPLLDRAAGHLLYRRLKTHYNDPALREEMTSGTSGVRMVVLLDRAQQARNEAHKLEMQRLIGATPAMTQVCLWAANEPLGLPGPPRGRLSRYFYPRLQFNGYTPDTSVFRAVYEACMAQRGCMLIGYAGAQAECAQTMLNQGWVVPPGHVRTGWTAAEALTDARRKVIRSAFNFEPRQMYGARELHWIGVECLHGTMHASARHILEIIDDDGNRVPDGTPGQLVVTDLYNDKMPMLRYVVGDNAVIEEARCACGRQGQVIREIQGRSTDYIRFANGTILHTIAIAWSMRDAWDTVQWQLIRHGEQDFEMLWTGEAIPANVQQQIVEICSRLLNGSSLKLRQVEFIPKTAGGKHAVYIDRRPEVNAAT